MINLSNDGSKFCFTHFSARWTDTDLNDTEKVPVYTYMNESSLKRLQQPGHCIVWGLGYSQTGQDDMAL